MSTEIMNEETCCPPFDPTLWDNKLFDWENKLFIKGRVKTFFYMPLNFGKVIARMSHLVEENQSTIPDWLCLSDHTSKWNMDLYLAVDHEIPNIENIQLSGKFLSKVYEGNFNDTDKWYKEFNALAKLKGFTVEKMYMWYTTCPKCARKYGKNYVVIIAKVC